MVRLIHLRCFVSFDVFSRTGHLRRANSRNPLRNRTVHGHCTHLGNGEILSKSGFGKDLHLHRFWILADFCGRDARDLWRPRNAGHVCAHLVRCLVSQARLFVFVCLTFGKMGACFSRLDSLLNAVTLAGSIYGCPESTRMDRSQTNRHRQ